MFEEILLDKEQKLCQQQLDTILILLNKQNTRNIFTKLANYFFAISELTSGIYLHGKVGRGKTMLMEYFYQQAKLSKKITHYQHFIQDIHKKISYLRQKRDKFLVKKLATDLAQKYKLICIDEFDIQDNTDAIIIAGLFKELRQKSVFIFLTSNVIPNNLYLDCARRNILTNLIENFEKNFNILTLSNQHDYRLNNPSQSMNRIIFPANKSNSKKLQNIITNICPQEKLIKKYLHNAQRKILFQQIYNQILITNFNELFTRSLSYLDYIEITKNFSIIIVDQVRQINYYENNLIIRLINFIDQAYFNKISLYMYILVKPEEIYPQGKYKNEFKRAISRLYEMNKEYYQA